MSRTDRDVTRIVQSWLEHGVTALPDRVLDAVLDQLPATPQRRSWWSARRHPGINNTGRIALAVGAVLVIAVIGYPFLPGSSVGGPGPEARPTPIPTATPTAPVPTPLETTTSGSTTFVVRMDGASPNLQTYQATVTFPPYYGWTIEGGPIAVATGSAGGFSAWTISGIYPDPCHWEGVQTEPLPQHGASHYGHIDQIAAMLASQPGRNPSEPTHVTVGGWSATRIDLSLPADLAVRTCDGGQYRSWSDPTGLGGPGYRDCGGCQPNTLARESVYILDIDRGVVVIDVWTYPGMTSDGAQAALDSVLASLVVGFGD